ncbi:MAG: hypothetical protein EHM41_25795, partial [Chloroflexi bacterium]
SGKDLTYTITDTIPTGLTYVPGSATNGATVTGNILTWEGVIEGERSYQVATSTEDPACSVPSANSGNYTDLELYGISVNSELDGDTTAEGLLFPGDPFNFYGIDQTTALYYGDDGFAFFDPDNFAGSVWENQAIPDIDVPNGLIAAFWNDWEIVRDLVTNKGVTVASLGNPTIAALIEYDDIIPFGGDGSEYIDFEMFMWKDVSDVPGDYEIYFAYDNIVGDFTTGTIGAESPDGTEATIAAYNDSVLTSLSNGSAICLDWAVPMTPVEFSYQVMVDEMASGTLTNHAAHKTDNPGSKEEYVSVEVTVMANTAPVLNEMGDQEVDELVLLTFTATATDADDDDLTFEIEGLPVGASFDEENGEFTWTPAEDQDGIHPITITVSDGDKEDFESFTITVNEVNQAPVLADIFDKVGNVGDLLTFTASATDEDLPQNTLTYSLEGAPAGAAINSTTGLFTWTPTTADIYTFDVVVNDGTGMENAADKETIKVTVGPLLNAIGNQTVNEGDELTFTATAEGSGVYTFAIENGPTNASFDTATGAFSWTTDETDGDSVYNATISVSDGTTTDSE